MIEWIAEINGPLWIVAAFMVGIVVISVFALPSLIVLGVLFLLFILLVSLMFAVIYGAFQAVAETRKEGRNES